MPKEVTSLPLKSVSESVRSHDQVSLLLVWTDGFLSILLFCASEIDSPFATHCPKQEVLNTGCVIECLGKLLENVMPEPHHHRVLFNWL